MDKILDFFKKNVDPNTFVKEFTLFFAKSFNWIDKFQNSDVIDKYGAEDLINDISGERFQNSHSNVKDKNEVEELTNGFSKMNLNEGAQLFESIYHFIQRKFHGTKVTNFGQEIFHTCSFELKKAFLLSYFKSFLYEQTWIFKGKIQGFYCFFMKFTIVIRRNAAKF